MNTRAERAALAGSLLRLRAEIIAAQIRHFREMLKNQS